MTRRPLNLTVVAAVGVALSLAMTACGKIEHTSPLVAHAIPIVLKTAPTGPIPWTFAICNKGAKPMSAAIAMQGALADVPVSLDDALLPASACTTARIQVPAAPFAQAGWYAIPIAHGHEAIGTLGIARRPDVAKTLNLKIEPDPPTLTLVAGSPAGIVVHSQSTDGSTPVAWHVKAFTWFASGAAELGGGSDVVEIPLRCPSRVRLLWELWPLRRDGHVVLSLGREPGQTGPVLSKTVPVKVRLMMYEEVAQGIITTLVILFLLAIGGGLAYLLNTVWPLHRRRRKLRDTLDNIIGELRGLDDKCISAYQDIRHLILCDAKQVCHEVTRYVIVNPELAIALDKLEPAAQVLTLKTWGLNRLVALRKQIPKPAGQGLGLLAVEMLRSACEHVANGLRTMGTGRDQLMALFHELDRAFSILASAGGEHPIVRETLGHRCRELRTTVEALRKASDPRWLEMCAALPALGAAVNAVEPETVHPGDQHARELHMWAVSAALDGYRSGRALEGETLTTLRSVFATPRWDDFIDAHQFFSAQPRRTDKEIVAALSNGAACKIRPSHEPIRPGELVAFTLWFDDDDLNYASTRQRWLCDWQVDDTTQQSGFTYWHAFPEPKNGTSAAHCVRITTFTSPDRKTTVEREVETLPISLLGTPQTRIPQSWFTTLSTLFLVQLVALFGLLTGEVDVIERRDPLAATLILIATGFGADTIRSLIAAGASRVASTITQATASTVAAASIATGSACAASADPPAGSQLARRLGL